VRSHHLFVRIILVVVSSLALVAMTSSLASAHGRGHHKTNRGQGHNPAKGRKRELYVSPTGKAGAADRNCDSAAYATVQSAVSAASAGSTVVVCRGTYTEDVIVSTPLTLTGEQGAVIHGSSTANGMCDQLGPGGPGSAPCLAGITIKSGHVTVQGLTVTGAIGEGILATGSLSGGSIGDVVIQGNRVVGNDTGGIPPTTKSSYPQCVEVGQAPGDCGEGIHLMGAFDSTVSHNFVSGNTGGVLLTDEFGPTHDNVVEHNVITDNAFDCGVTAPGHNPNALDSSGNRQPSKAGVYDNVIRYNRITDNGLKGEGAGVLFANATAGTASYDNLVEHNYIAGNELSGVTMHAHTLMSGQFEDLSGNRIVHNTIGTNNTGGDPLDGTTSDPSTTGILVFSGTVPVKVTIAHNRIRDNHYGIWVGVAGNVTATLSHNVFQHVTTTVFTSP
jgi:nitrous oxidase accessory protein NosD